MLIPLEEFRSNLDKYMKIALITDVTITSANRELTWILSSPKADWWTEKVLPLLKPNGAVA